jgi:hypothetical protein
MKKPAILFSLVALAITGCGYSSISSPTLTNSAIHSSAIAAPANKAEFTKAVAALGVKLTEDQLATISANRSAKPNGKWAPRPAVNLTAEQNLTVHFKKHGYQFNPQIPTEEAYLAQAISLANGERGKIQYYFDINSFKKGYQSNVVIWNSTSKELTAMRPDGAMTTYYRDPNLQASRFVIVPQF